MYLVHAALRRPADGRALPPGVRGLLLAARCPGEGIEHVVVHREAVPHPVLGVFLLAGSLVEAERRVAVFCDRVLAGVPELAGWRVERAEAPLVGPFYERLLAAPGPAGRNGPGTFPSTGEAFPGA
ncbi:hypothetical protein [Kitasatospora sp. NPDC093806]|uniref:hypothetical protein n=1 Tax=Kitasatospora sp. NPDC093806 TaxID=3155075 RepID=UPI00343CA13F